MSQGDVLQDEGESRQPEVNSEPVAAILLIGNEILSGKIRDENAYWLTQELRKLGVRVVEIAVVPDEREAIGEALRRLAGSVDYLFTSGGVGPTHDDITLESVADAFGVPLCEDPDLVALLQRFFQDRITDAHLRMARVPEGSTLIKIAENPWPVYSFRNIYIFPGVPHILQHKFKAIAERFRARPFSLERLYVDAEEGSIAAYLEEVERTYQVEIGSYPRTKRSARYRVMLTIEGRSAEQVKAATGALIDALPAGALLSRGEAPSEQVPAADLERKA
ncbi:MAG: molybdopterin-binding protein [Myxococcota bacterium]|nr:molybdopterin-binding protein [Myxococcota bacterium]